MWNLIPGKLKVIGAAILAAAVTLLGVFLKGRSSGKKAVEVKDLKRDLEVARTTNDTIRKTNDVAVGVGALSESDVTGRLRDKWSRD